MRPRVLTKWFCFVNAESSGQCLYWAGPISDSRGISRDGSESGGKCSSRYGRKKASTTDNPEPYMAAGHWPSIRKIEFEWWNKDGRGT